MDILYRYFQVHTIPRGHDAAKKPRIESKRKPVKFWIPRIRLMFCAEDPVTFSQRVFTAYELRRKTEILLRYHLYIDCMPTDGVPNITPEMLERITKWAKGSRVVQNETRYDDSYYHV